MADADIAGLLGLDQVDISISPDHDLGAVEIVVASPGVRVTYLLCKLAALDAALQLAGAAGASRLTAQPRAPA